MWRPSESRDLIENYYVNLAERGGGAVYMTDHDVYCEYMFNDVMSLIGYEACGGNFGGSLPFDGDNALMSSPNEITLLYNDSTTGSVPYGLQPNGEILYSLAYYGGNTDTPAISTTIEGGLGFHVDIEAPVPMKMSLEGDDLTFEATADSGTDPVTWTWSSDVQGELGSGTPLTVALTTPGLHEITLTGTDASSRVDTDTRFVWVVASDSDGDGVPVFEDNCPEQSNAEQADHDDDGIGDACDCDAQRDDDGDGVSNGDDPCPDDPDDSGATVCPADYAPVCGIDSVVYTNSCEALVAGVDVGDNDACAASSCAEVKSASPDSQDGVYWLVENGALV
jgi:hypothetical protein